MKYDVIERACRKGLRETTDRLSYSPVAINLAWLWWSPTASEALSYDLNPLNVNAVCYRPFSGGVASRLPTAIYVAMVTPILYGNSYSPNDSNLKYESYWSYG